MRFFFYSIALYMIFYFAAKRQGSFSTRIGCPFHAFDEGCLLQSKLTHDIHCGFHEPDRRSIARARIFVLSDSQ
jgi:hypothetical protein